ncbi:unnamed protein product [Rotaria sp. Silwood1]|nr:unnamed protein product [Rotaria sp. Silwood1]CAF1313212.1 unnamed protein product [Rotaria sp. Silwood1]CAF3491817.1 unnamed protein product [Rotaria sp. Silwood1]
MLQNITFTNGQMVIPMKAEDSCVPSIISVRCQQNYVVVVVVRSAFYGVAQIADSCSYTTGDCIADAMSIVTCTVDTLQCNMYAARKKLPQCNDQYSSYIHVEYECVPISMDDSTKEYNVCQNSTEITSDHGIIRSPGYPTQFQTTTSECFRAIRVPNDKIIRLWLTELYIGSTLGTCAKDHVYVVDSVQTYRHCARVRYAYPYLCSSTIIIQYYVTTQLSIYHGMRMYFEIVDRPSNDNCPNIDGTVTPVLSTPPTVTTINPSQTTAVPAYVLLGIASPVRSFQICRGQSFNIVCPDNYGVIITTNIFGVTQSDQCEQHDASKHCVITTAPTFACRRSCTFFYPGNQVVSSCGGRTAVYQYIEYQCIPTNTELVSPNTSCPSDGSKIPVLINRRGRFQTYGYPSFTKMNCTYRMKTNVGYIMNFYALDISLNDFSTECKSNKITFLEDGESEGTDFCEERSYSLIYSSCSNELDVSYTANDETTFFSSGAQLYIESQTRPSDWACGKSVITSSQTTIPTTPFITQTAVALTNETNMFARDEIEHDICFSSSLSYSCPSGYTFIILGAFYGVKKQSSNQCRFVQGDCVQETLSTITQCRTDAPACFISYSMRRRLARCSDQYADYLHVTSQCVPQWLGTVSNITTYDICDTNNPIASIHGIVTSPNFPTYKQTNNECRRTLLGITDRIAKIWINEMAISSGEQRRSDEYSNEPDLVISKNDDTNNLDDIERMYSSIRDTCVNDYLIINAPHVVYVYCGIRKLSIAPICATTLDIQYKATSSPNFSYKGFKLYFERISKPMEIICDNPLPSTTTPINEQIPIWAQNLELSPILSVHICLGAAITLRCPRGSDYVLSIIKSIYTTTGTSQCEIPSSTHCRQEASLGLTCTQSCFIEYNIPKPLVQCGLLNADYLYIDYECIPTRLPNNENPIDICQSTTDTIALDRVMMVSPQYPTLHAIGRSCLKRLEASKNKLWMIYIVDLHLEVGLIDNPECDRASLTINDGKDKRVLCGLRQPELVLIGCSNITCTSDGFTTTATTTATTTTTIATTAATTTTIATATTTIATTAATTTIATTATTTTIIATAAATTTATTTLWTTPFGTGAVSTSNQQTFTCGQQPLLLECDQSGYGLILHKVQLGASQTGDCTFSSNDCVEDRTKIYNTCAGKTLCYISTSAQSMKSCNGTKSNYVYVEYQCIPTRPKLISDICSSTDSSEKVEGGAIISSLNYTSESRTCKLQLQTSESLGSQSYKAFKIYILTLNLPIRPTLRDQGAQCSENDPSIEIDDPEAGVTRLCGNSHARYLLETCSNTIEIRYKNLIVNTDTTKYKGFEIYLESIQRNKCRPTLSPSIRTPPFNITSRIICGLASGRETVNFACTPNYGLVFLQSYHFVTKEPNQCNVNEYTCLYPSKQPQAQCSGQQTCSYTYPVPLLSPLNACQNSQADSTRFYYQCLPMRPSLEYSTVKFCFNSETSNEKGFIETPDYPNTYQNGKRQCSLTIRLPKNNDGKIYSIYLYIIGLSLRDTSTINPSSATECFDSIKYTDGDRTDSLCGKIDQPVLEYYTNKQEVNLTLNISEALPFSEWNNWQGARLFYIIGDQSLPSQPTSIDDTDKSSKGKLNLGGLIAGIVVGVLLVAVIIGFVLYRRHLLLKSSITPTVKYDNDTITVNGATTNEGTEKQTSTSVDLLKEPAT